ncbi:MAG: NAD(P)/FAD-dependent oxidoreductase, partial [Oligoflexia bacterium]|nr:NAD(P)/FAD-dependent oxidoreductase [Oligoflexia bacterium]
HRAHIPENRYNSHPDYYDVTLIDRTNHHLFQPLLYQVATAGLAPSDIAIPLRAIFKDHPNIRVVMGTVTTIDKNAQSVTISSGQTFNFDYLAIAIGSNASYFGHSNWEQFAPGLKSIHDAVAIREQILISLELAELESEISKRERYLNFVVIGGGPTGVEMAGAIAEITKNTIAKDFRNYSPLHSKIFLIQRDPQLLLDYPAKLAQKAKDDLNSLGVDVMLNTLVEDIDENGVKTNQGFIPSTNIVWAAGNEVSPLLKQLDLPLDAGGRIKINSNLSLPGHPNIFALGDCAHLLEKSAPLPAVATVALQQGAYLANLLHEKLENNTASNTASAANAETRGDLSFKYWDKGKMATIGRKKAVVQIGNFSVSGFPAWVLWLVIHIWFLISFHNKIMVFLEWTWAYFTFNRASRIIVHPSDKK